MSVRTRVHYDVMTQFDKGVMSPVSHFRDQNNQPLPSYDMSELGAHTFSSGFPSEETARGTLTRAQEYMLTMGAGEAWVEKITEITCRERLAND
jgi:hypothetical protein